MNIFLVAIGAAVGGVTRYLISGNPWRTLAINVLGSFVIGLLAVVCPAKFRPLLIVGFCGGFTTFSTFSNETLLMLKNAQYLMAGGYVLASVVGGILAAAVGYYLGGKL